MGKGHLKRFAAPKIWQIRRKRLKFITKPAPGPHSLVTGAALAVLLKETLNYANTTKEVKKILNSNSIKIDGKIRKNRKFPVGIFDTIEFVGVGEYFRVVLNKKGKLDFMRINKEESVTKPCKIIGKKIVKGRLQLNLYDGKNIFADKDAYKVGDTVFLSLPDQKITNHANLAKKSSIFLIGGKHIGETGDVEDVIGNRILYKDQKGNLIETLKKYAFVIGDSKSSINIRI